MINIEVDVFFSIMKLKILFPIFLIFNTVLIKYKYSFYIHFETFLKFNVTLSPKDFTFHRI